MKISRICSFLSGAVIIASSGFVFAPRIDAQNSTSTPKVVVSSSIAQLVVDRVLDEAVEAVEATLTIPRAWLPNETKTRIALYESGRPAIVAEAKRNFQIVGDTLQTNLRLEIAPGNYEIRLVRDDKTRTPFSPTVRFQINGLRREPGAWLFNGSMFVNRDTIQNDDNAPLFVKGLKRDLSVKAKKIARNIYTSAPLSWRVLEVPSGIAITDARFDFAALQARIEKKIADAKANKARNFLGFVLENAGFGEFNTNENVSKSELENAMKRIRQIIKAAAPDAALILKIDGSTQLFRPQVIEFCAPFCDAVVLERNGSGYNSDLLALKMLRRVAEEQPQYDLPIFVAPISIIFNRPDDNLPFDASIFQGLGFDYVDPQAELVLQNLDSLMSGATGLIEYSNDDLQRVFRRNASLFVNSVTIEDIGVLPAPEGFRTPTISAPGNKLSVLEGSSVEIYATLRDIGRIPLVARLPKKDEKKAPPETFLLRVGERISLDTVERLRANIERGVRVYIEGTPRFGEGEAEIQKQWEQIVGGVSQPLTQSGEKISRPTNVALNDVWTFGSARETKLRVQQETTVIVNAATLANRTKIEKGVDSLTAPRVLATVEDGSPALILNAVGRGQILWMPHRVLDVGNVASHAYYEAIAAQVQSGLVTLRDENGAPLPTPIRVALRRSPKGALLLALFNPSAKAVKLRASLDGIAAVALDLATEAELTIEKSGNQSTVSATVPANGWKLIAFGGDRKTFDEERNAPLFPARIK